MDPAVSIITVVKNNPEGLEKTCRSALSQNWEDWEQIIVLSLKDLETLEVAREFCKLDSRIKIVLEEESGIYQAMNRGISQARGKFLWFLNSGDCFFARDTLGIAINYATIQDVGVIIGGYSVRENGRCKSYFHRYANLGPLAFAFNRRGGCHQAMIFDSGAVKTLGGYKLKFHLAADFDLVLSVLERFRGARYSQIFANIEPGGISSVQLAKVHSEKHQIRKEHFSATWISIPSNIWTILVRIKIFLRGITLKLQNKPQF